MNLLELSKQNRILLNKIMKSIEEWEEDEIEPEDLDFNFDEEEL